MTTSITILDSQTEPEVEILTGVSWESYERLLEEYGDRRMPHSYIDGELRIMSPGFRHEHLKRWFARLIDAMTEELEIPQCSLGSTTLKSQASRRGAEPDEGFLIANENAPAGSVDYDAAMHSPPDLLVEVDITSPSLERLKVYAALRVPEVWTYDGNNLTVKLLKDNSYADSESSAVFPFLPMDEFANWLDKAFEFNETVWIRKFRQWVRDTLKSDE